MKKSKKYKDMSMKHEGMESKAMEARETMLEKRGYEETKSGKMKPMKAKEGKMIVKGQKGIQVNKQYFGEY
jgi:hypothetical protein